MIISVDFDNTLAMGNSSHISQLKPNKELIERLNKTDAYKIITTARGAKYGLSLKAKKKLYLDPIKFWLQANGVLYDEISFNKEYAHLYIDDMTIRPDEAFKLIQSKFTKNPIVFTDFSVVKSCCTSLGEAQWYKEAQVMGIKTPKVMFVNDELIITERIYGRKPAAKEIIQVSKSFINLPCLNIPFQTYIDNICNEKIKLYLSELNLTSTFFHGDLTCENVVVNETGIYLIDPNSRGIFGNYQADLAKAAWSFYAHEKDMKSVLEIVGERGNWFWLLIAAEGDRVVKYRKEYSDMVLNCLAIYESSIGL